MKTWKVLGTGSTFCLIFGCASVGHNVSGDSSRNPAQAADGAKPVTAVRLFNGNSVRGAATTYAVPTSANPELCLELTRFPESSGADYKGSDEKEESRLCAIDLYHDNSVTMCPKEVSTSPGTIIYKIDDGLSPLDWEQKYCKNKSTQKAGEEKSLAKFKNTINEGGPRSTSGTNSISSLLYYHFSRYFGADVSVPVSVFRTINRQEHYKMVSSHGTGGGQLGNGWFHMQQIESNPSADPVNAKATLLPSAAGDTDGYGDIFGILLKKKGMRAGPELNGNRETGWGDPQNVERLSTPGFEALDSSQPLEDAIKAGLQAAKANPNDRPRHMAKAFGTAPYDNFQGALFMRDSLQIAVLDYIFNQQDRVGNIDAEWEGYYVGPKLDDDCHPVSDAVGVNHVAIKFPGSKEDTSFADYAQARQLAQKTCLKTQQNFHVVERAHINDNDAGGMRAYANFTNKSHQLENLHHFNAHTYHQLMQLADDFAKRGPLFNYVHSTFGMDEASFKDMSGNIANLAALLKKQCSNIQFDVEPDALLQAEVDPSGHPFHFPQTADVCDGKATE